MESMGERIKRLREKKGLTQKELSKIIGVTVPSLSRYENNLRKLSPETIGQLARVLNTTSDYLISAYIPSVDSHGNPVTEQDMDQYDDFINKASTFFMNDEVSDMDKEALFRDISELFWKSRSESK